MTKDEWQHGQGEPRIHLHEGRKSQVSRLNVNLVTSENWISMFFWVSLHWFLFHFNVWQNSLQIKNKNKIKIIWTIFCCLFAYLVLLNWMPNLVNFILLGARYFFIPINTLELYSEMWFSLERQFIWGLTFKTS